MKAFLRITTGDKHIDRMLKSGETTVLGRAPNTNIEVPIEDSKMSSMHCRFTLKHDRLEVCDLQSKNGTELNGMRIETGEVFIGDVVSVGSTKITLKEESMDADSIQLLTFPGPFPERANFELTADFTGARIQNQLLKGPSRSKQQVLSSQDKEIEVRKKVKSNLKLSKEVIRNRNWFRTIFASLLDISAVVATLVSAVVLVEFLCEQPDFSEIKKMKVIYTLFLAGLATVSFLILNFKIFKFTFGEQLVGIKKLCTNQ